MLIAQISDIHATAGAPSLAAIRRAVSVMSRLRVDAAIVSGDLVETPSEDNYRLVRSELAHLSCPVFVIPGNVDDRSAMRAVFDDHRYWPAAGPMDFTVEVNDRVRLIGFDVTVPGEAFGHATEAGLRWLAAECARAPRLPIILMMHQHPFATGIAPLDAAMCRNGEGLADVVEGVRERFALVVCGHGHRPVFTTFRSVPAVMCPSLAPANPLMLAGYGTPGLADPPGFLVHDLHRTGVNSHAISLA